MRGYAKDPVCGMLVNEEQAGFDKMTEKVAEQTYYFCSSRCKEEFKTNTERFIKDKTRSANA